MAGETEKWPKITCHRLLLAALLDDEIFSVLLLLSGLKTSLHISARLKLLKHPFFPPWTVIK